MATCTDLKKPTAYYLLNRMAQDGWIEERQEQEGNRPPRKVYRLTGQGEAAFQRLLRENLSSYPPPGDIGLAFLDALEPVEAQHLLSQRRAAIAVALAAAEQAPQHQGSLQWMIEHQICHLKAELAWVERLLARLD